MDNFQPHVDIKWHFINTNIQPKTQTHPPIFSLSFTAETGATAATPCATTLGGFRPLLRPLLGYPNFPLLPAIMPNHLLHSKQLPPSSNSSLKWGISQTLTCFILSFMVVFFMGYVWMIKLIVIVQFLLSLEMFGVMGIWSRGWFSWFCNCWTAAAENSGNHRIVQKFWNFYCRFYILFGIFWQTFMKFGGVISELWNFEENCPVLDTNLVIMY